jgi:hypothetical protein
MSKKNSAVMAELFDEDSKKSMVQKGKLLDNPPSKVHYFKRIDAMAGKKKNVKMVS